MIDQNDNEHKKTSYRKPRISQSVLQPLQRKFYDNADLKIMFKVSERTLQRWRDEGTLSYKKIGGRIFYSAEKIDKMVEDE